MIRCAFTYISIILSTCLAFNTRATDESDLFRLFQESCEGAATRNAFEGLSIIKAVEEQAPQFEAGQVDQASKLNLLRDQVAAGPRDTDFLNYRVNFLLFLKYAFTKIEARLAVEARADLSSILTRDDLAVLADAGFHLRGSSRDGPGMQYEVYGDSPAATGTLLSLITDPYLISYLQEKFLRLETLVISLDRAIDEKSARKHESEIAVEILVPALMKDTSSPYRGAAELVTFMGYGDSPYTLRFRGSQTLDSWETELNRQLESRSPKLPAINLSPSQLFIAFVASFHGSTMRHIRKLYGEDTFPRVENYSLWLRSSAILAPERALRIRSLFSLESAGFVFAPGLPEAPDFWIVPEKYQD